VRTVAKACAAAFAALLMLSAPAPAQIEWDKRTADAPLDNPTMVRVSRDEALDLVKRVLEHYGHAVKSSTCDDGRGACTLVTDQLVFTRGIVADSRFRHVAELGNGDVRNVVRARVVLRVEVTPAKPGVTSVGISGAFEGLVEAAVGSEWVSSRSRGFYEDRLLRGVVNLANGLALEDVRVEEDEPTEDQPVKPGGAQKP
jgi:hypothetical protein